MAFYTDNILLVDKDGDVLTISGGARAHADGETVVLPTIGIAQDVKFDELNTEDGYCGVVNSGKHQSVFLTAEDFKRILPRLVREFYGPNATFTINEG